MAGQRQKVCPWCWSPDRTRLLWLYLEREMQIGTTRRRVLHVAPERGIAKRLAALRQIDYVAVDLAGRNGAIRADLCDLPFPSDDFDLVFCSHVLEHIPDDRRAMREMKRVSRGVALLQHPSDDSLETTYEDPSIVTPEGRERAFGQFDHVRVYGRDLKDRLAAVGYEVTVVDYAARLSVVERQRFQIGDGMIHVCR
jgi:SAM-dependent methyltransferase